VLEARAAGDGGKAAGDSDGGNTFLSQAFREETRKITNACANPAGLVEKLLSGLPFETFTRLTVGKVRAREYDSKTILRSQE
jgi:hypothetical protein